MNSQRSILIVDDEDDLKLSISSYLSRKNFKVIGASDGQRAKDIMSGANDIQIVVSDLRLGKLTGIELLNYVRQDLGKTELPFIIMSGMTEQEAIDDAKSHGVTDFITKPFRLAELAELLNKYI
jgi:two-component system, response regulator FlrC